MGDNIFLGDRDGVRTPMQWSPDRNGGFSRADPARLLLPPIMDPLYGYQAVNVEAQSRSTRTRLLNWMRRMLAVRKRASRLRPRHAELPLSRQPQGPGLSARAMRTRSCSASSISRARRRRWSSISPASAGRVPMELVGRQRLSADRRAALSADPAALRLLLVPARPGAALAGVARAAAERCRISSPWSCGRGLVGRCSTVTAGSSSRPKCCPLYLPRRRWFAGKGSGSPATRSRPRYAAGRRQGAAGLVR